MDRTPPEVLFLILKHIPPRQLFKFRRINRTFNEVISKNSRRLPKEAINLTIAKRESPDSDFEDFDIDISIEFSFDSNKEDEEIHPTSFPKHIVECIQIYEDGISFEDYVDEDDQYVPRREMAEFVAAKCGIKMERREDPDFDFFLRMDDTSAVCRFIFQLIAEKFDLYTFTLDLCNAVVPIRNEFLACMEKTGARILDLETHSGPFFDDHIFYFYNFFGVTKFAFDDPGFVDDLLLYQDRFSINGGNLQHLDSLTRLIKTWENGGFNFVEAQFRIDESCLDEAIELLAKIGAEYIIAFQDPGFSFPNLHRFEITRNSDKSELMILIRISSEEGTIVRVQNIDHDLR